MGIFLSLWLTSHQDRSYPGTSQARWLVPVPCACRLRELSQWTHQTRNFGGVLFNRWSLRMVSVSTGGWFIDLVVSIVMGIPQNWWFIMENPFKMGDPGVPTFWEPPCMPLSPIFGEMRWSISVGLLMILSVCWHMLVRVGGIIPKWPTLCFAFCLIMNSDRCDGALQKTTSGKQT